MLFSILHFYLLFSNKSSVVFFLLPLIILATRVKDPNGKRKCYDGNWMKQSKYIASVKLSRKESRACMVTIEFKIKGEEEDTYTDMETNEIMEEVYCDAETIHGTVAAHPENRPLVELDNYKPPPNAFDDPKPGEIDAGWEPELEDDREQRLVAEASGTVPKQTTESHTWITEKPWLAPHCRAAKPRPGGDKTILFIDCFCYTDYCNSIDGNNIMDILMGSCRIDPQNRTDDADGINRCKPGLVMAVSCLQNKLEEEFNITKRPDIVAIASNPDVWVAYTNDPIAYNATKRPTRGPRTKGSTSSSISQKEEAEKKKVAVIVALFVVGTIIILGGLLGLGVFCWLRWKKKKAVASDNEEEEDDDEEEESSDDSLGKPHEEMSAKGMDSTGQEFSGGELTKSSMKDGGATTGEQTGLDDPLKDDSDEIGLKDAFKKIKQKTNKLDGDESSSVLKFGAELDDSSVGGEGLGGGPSGSQSSQGHKRNQQKQTGQKGDQGKGKGNSKGTGKKKTGKKKNTKKTGKKSKGKKTKKTKKRKTKRKSKGKGKKK